jgi:transposase
MGSNNSKYTPEFRERTCRHIIESGQSASAVGRELGVDKNTICDWMRDYREKEKLPSYRESKGIKVAATRETRIVNIQSKVDKKRIAELEEEVEILKKAVRIFTQASR